MTVSDRPRAGAASVRLVEGVVPLGQVLLRAARLAPEREALVFPGFRESFAELAERAWGIASSLVGLGVRPGDHVGLLMTNHPDQVASLFGAAMAGAVVVPVNARYRTTELAFIVDDADLVALLTHDAADDHVDFCGLLHDALPGLADARDPLDLRLPEHPRLRAVVDLGRRRPAGIVSRSEFDALADAADPDQVRARCENARLRDVGIVIYTSGTTSAPRGAMLTHEAFVRSWMVEGDIFELEPGDRVWTPLPLFHVTALGVLVFTLGHGATFVTDHFFDAGRGLETIERERPTAIYTSYPPVTEALLNHPRRRETDLSSIKTFLSVAPPETLRKFQHALPHAVQLTTYGLTEGGPITCTRRDDPLEVRIGTCGRPMPGAELRICDPDGRVLGPGEQGEIHMRGSNVFSGYYKHPEKNAETFLADGWARTGDLGRLYEDGSVLFLGRLKEMLKVGGENVAPAEVEAQLGTHPAVSLAQVVSLPDARLGEVPAAFVELVPGATATEEELVAHCRGRIASFKVPRVVRIVEGHEWPMSATKIQRFRLRDRLLRELGIDGEDGARQDP